MPDDDKNQSQKEPECHAVAYPNPPKRIILHMENIDDPVIADAFVEAFAEALTKTDYTDDITSGKVVCSWSVINCRVTKIAASKLADHVEKKGA